MRYMLLLKADKNTESGAMPEEKVIEAMMKYNEDLVKAGALLDAGGLWPSSAGARVTFTKGKPNATDGPFTETKELIAGFWIINVKSKEEAVEWASRVPFGNGDGQIEVRRMFEAPEQTDNQELITQEDALKAEIEKQKNG